MAPFCFRLGFAAVIQSSRRCSISFVWLSYRSITHLDCYKVSQGLNASVSFPLVSLPRLHHVSHKSCSRTHRLYRRLPAQRPRLPQGPLHCLPSIFARLQIPPLQRTRARVGKSSRKDFPDHSNASCKTRPIFPRITDYWKFHGPPLFHLRLVSIAFPSTHGSATARMY